MENNFWCEKFLFNIDINEREEAMSSSAESNWDTNAVCFGSVMMIGPGSDLKKILECH